MFGDFHDIMIAFFLIHDSKVNALILAYRNTQI
jgi:hypothetical protein